MKFLLLIVLFPMSLMARDILVHGHRGARAIFPENTLPAFRYAIEQGADVLELDMGVTKDRQIIVNHDTTINAALCLDRDGKAFAKGPKIFDLSLVEVKKYDCGSIKNPKFPKQQTVPHTQIPTLEEVFQMVQSSSLPQAKKIKFNIETKMGGKGETVEPAEFINLVLSLINKYKLLDRIILQSFDYRTLQVAKIKEPKIILSALTESASEDWVQTLKSLGAQYISPDYNLVSAQKVKAVHAMGARLAPWTADDENTWTKLRDMKVDEIITDDPKALIDFLDKKSEKLTERKYDARQI